MRPFYKLHKIHDSYIILFHGLRVYNGVEDCLNQCSFFFSEGVRSKLSIIQVTNLQMWRWEKSQRQDNNSAKEESTWKENI